MVFHSDLFDTHPTYQLLKSLLLDFFNGHALSEMPLGAVEHVISITAGPLTPGTSSTEETTAPLPLVHLRTYSIALLPAPSSSRAPKLQMTEMGPSIDLSLRRVQAADEERMAQALRRPRVAKKDVESGLGKKRKNIETDEMGDTVGKIHLPRQDLNKMQGRKMKGLKVHREGKKGAAAPEDGAGAGEDAAMEESAAGPDCFAVAPAMIMKCMYIYDPTCFIYVFPCTGE